MNSRWDYETLDNVLYSTGCGYSAAYLHGYVVAHNLLGTSPEQLKDQITSELADLSEDLRFDLLVIAEENREQLLDTEFSFQLLLPSDDEDFSHRLHALSQWCHGLLLVTNAYADYWSSEEAQELLQDLHDIAEVEIEPDLDDADDDEDQEADLLDLIEFVRVSVLYLAEESFNRVEH